jgi:hypothetical protein
MSPPYKTSVFVNFVQATCKSLSSSLEYKKQIYKLKLIQKKNVYVVASLLAASLLIADLIFAFSTRNTKEANIPTYMVSEVLNEESGNAWKNKNTQRSGSNSHYYISLN